MSEQTTESRASWLAVFRFNWSLLATWQRWALVGVAAFVTLLLLGGVADAVASYGKVHRGVVVSGVKLGGFTPAEASASLADLGAALESEPAIATVRDETATVWPAQIAYRLDVTATVDRAYRVGRRGFPDAILRRIVGWFKPIDVEPVARYDSHRLDLRVAAIARHLDRPPQDAQVIDIDGHPAAVPAADGITVQAPAARQAILDALGSEDMRTFDVPIEVELPRIGTEAARQAAADLEIAISEPLVLAYKKNTWRVKGPVIRRWMNVTPKPTTDRADGPLTLVVTPDADKVQATIAKITEPLVKPAVDAKFEVDGANVKVIPSRTGLAVDTKAAFDLISRRLQQTVGKRKVGLTLHAIHPDLSTAEAKEMGIRRRLSSYTTEYSSGNAPRVNNIRLLSRALDNTLIAPGDEFSFNRSIGPRTAEKGYEEAPVIINGKLVPALGGGICQVGTTIFNTVFFSGLPVVERTNHSFYINHYPDGRDATVSWGGPDFRFRNDTKNWILIKTWASTSNVTIALYGTDPGYDVEYKTGQWRNKVSYPVREIKDAKMPVNSIVVEESGVTGHDVTVVRVVKKKGKVVREDTFASHYRPKEQVVRVGTKPLPTDPPAQPTTPTGSGGGTNTAR